MWSQLSIISNYKLTPTIRRPSSAAAANMMTTSNRNLSTEDPELRDFVGFLESLKNYEKSGVPKGAGTDSSEGFDLGRMKRLTLRLHNPHLNYKVPLLIPIAENLLSYHLQSLNLSAYLIGRSCGWNQGKRFNFCFSI